MRESFAFPRFIIILVIIACGSVFCQYTPNWESLDSRPLPTWYDEGKVGIFIVWGVYSVPSYGNEWFWYNWEVKSPPIVDYMKRNFPPDFTYPDFAKELHAELYDPDYWADVFKDAGARYIVLTTKHHDGYTLWPSKYSWNWNSGAVGPNMDLVGMLADSIRKRTDIQFGLYHSLFEWFNPMFLSDKANGFNTSEFVDAKAMPELYEIVNRYKPAVIWSDGAWLASPEYWKSKQFIAWLYNESPVKDSVVVNDRWGVGATCNHGGFYTCHDRYNPGHLVKHKWENAMTLDRHSWSYSRNSTAADYLSFGELLEELVTTISCGGNILINVGPTADGRLPPIMEERLRKLGAWLRTNGEAVYSSRPWQHQNDSSAKVVWYTAREGLVYAFVLQWPADGLLRLAAPVANADTGATLLGDGHALQVQAKQPRGLVVQLPQLQPGGLLVSFPAWVVRLSHVSG